MRGMAMTATHTTGAPPVSDSSSLQHSVELNAEAAIDKAGLQRLDVITAVDGQVVQNQDELVSAIASHRAGEVVKLTIVRDGATPAVMRLYDAIESKRSHGGDGTRCTLLVLDEGGSRVRASEAREGGVLNTTSTQTTTFGLGLQATWNGRIAGTKGTGRQRAPQGTGPRLPVAQAIGDWRLRHH